MVWRIEFSQDATKSLKRIDLQAARLVTRYLRERVAATADPRQYGKSLQGELREYWRYRVGSYRVICRIEDDCLRVLIVRIAHRKHVYNRR